MRDRDFLKWIHNRLILTHGEHRNYDYMWKLRAIIEATPKDKETSNATQLSAEELLEGE